MNLLRRSILAAPLVWVLSAQSVPDDFQQVGRVVAVGDVHGEKDALVAVLKMAGVIDEKERWSGGSTHLVQIGDLPARGPQTREAFDLLMRLEKEAASAGGKVHALIGNHEVVNMSVDLRNVLPEEAIGRLNENAGAVASVRLASAGAAMLQIDQDVQRLAHDVVRAFAFHVDDEADATCIALVTRVVQTGYFRSEHRRHILQLRAPIRKYNDLRIFMRAAHEALSGCPHRG